MTTEERIEYMRSHGSSLDMNWGEDNEVWEVSWITGGKRFTAFSKELSIGLEEVHSKAFAAFQVKLR